jgi:hypothetical protein
MKGQVKTPKESHQLRARDTHILSSADGQRDKSRRRKELSKRRAPTNYRAKSEEQVRTPKRTQRATGTHFLSIAEERTSEDTERKSVSNRHSQTAKRRGRSEDTERKHVNE